MCARGEARNEDGWVVKSGRQERFRLDDPSIDNPLDQTIRSRSRSTIWDQTPKTGPRPSDSPHRSLQEWVLSSPTDGRAHVEHASAGIGQTSLECHHLRREPAGWTRGFAARRCRRRLRPRGQGVRTLAPQLAPPTGDEHAFAPAPLQMDTRLRRQRRRERSKERGGGGAAEGGNTPTQTARPRRQTSRRAWQFPEAHGPDRGKEHGDPARPP